MVWNCHILECREHKHVDIVDLLLVRYARLPLTLPTVPFVHRQRQSSNRLREWCGCELSSHVGDVVVPENNWVEMNFRHKDVPSEPTLVIRAKHNTANRIFKKGAVSLRVIWISTRFTIDLKFGSEFYCLCFHARRFSRVHDGREVQSAPYFFSNEFFFLFITKKLFFFP